MKEAPDAGRRSVLINAATAGAILAGWALWRGQDVNWDLHNYHLYGVFALLHGRLHADVAPAGAQSFLNPLPYLLPYLAWRHLPAVAGALLIVTTQAVAIVLGGVLAGHLWGERAGRAGVSWAATVAAATGSMVLTETGTSFADLVLAVPSVLSLILLLPRADRPVRSLSSGIAVGIAVGLKPTNMFLLPAFAGAVVVAAVRGQRLRALLRGIGGAALGGAASGGAWAWVLWRDYGSPVFPFMNSVLDAPSAAPLDFADPRYHWQGIGHALALPFELAVGSMAACEVTVRDARLAIALPITAIVLVRSLRGAARDRWAAPCVWLLLGAAFWLRLCPIQRYAIALEIAAAVLAVAAAARLAGRWAVPAAVAMAGLLAVTAQPGDFFHRAYSNPFHPRVPEAVAPGATYGLVAQPLGYWVTVAPAPAHAFLAQTELLRPGGQLDARLDGMLDAPDLWLLMEDIPVTPAVRDAMRAHGLVAAPPCLRTPSMYWIDTVFCRGRHGESRYAAASDLAIGETVRFGSDEDGTGLLYELDGFDATGHGGTPTLGRTAHLAFHLTGPPSGSVKLAFTVVGDARSPPHGVTAQAGDGPRVVWVVNARDGPVTRQLCVGAERMAGDVIKVRFSTDEPSPASGTATALEPGPLALQILTMGAFAASPGACP